MNNLKKPIKQDNLTLEEITCEALLLQFKEPKFYDLTIPSPHEIYSLIVLAGKILEGQKINPEEVHCMSTRHDVFKNELKKEYFSKLTSRVFNGIHLALNEPKSDYSELYKFMNYRGDVLGRENRWYRFRDNKREEVENEVNSYFKKKELSDFNRIGEIIQPYIGLTDRISKGEEV